MATLTQQIFDKEEFLENSNSGLDFYEFVIGDLRKVDSDRCENVLNPFYDDGKPSFSVYYRNEMWRFHDHGDPSYSGNVFLFAAFHYGLDVKRHFGEILRRMYEDLKISPLDKAIEIDDIIFETGYLLLGKPFNDPQGVDKAHEYFKQFGITKQILKQFGVRAISSFFLWINMET